MKVENESLRLKKIFPQVMPKAIVAHNIIRLFLRTRRKNGYIKMTIDEGTPGLGESARAWDVKERMQTIVAFIFTSFLE